MKDNRGHQIVAELKARAEKETLEPGRQGLAYFLNEKAEEVKLFADIFDQVCARIPQSDPGLHVLRPVPPYFLEHHPSPQPKVKEMTIEQRCRELTIDQLGLNAVDLGLSSRFIEDLGADSLDIVGLIMGAEEEFNIEIQDEEVDNLKTFGEAVKFIERKRTE